MAQYDELLKEFEINERSSKRALALMEQVAQRLHEAMTRYNWVGFYLMDTSTHDALVLGPYARQLYAHLAYPAR